MPLPVSPGRINGLKLQDPIQLLDSLVVLSSRMWKVAVV
jgi:hypothetical protein